MNLQMLSHYRIVTKLGEGAMGEVYLAEDTKLNRKVAIKSLPPKLLADEAARARLLREAQTTARLDHPNICTIHGQVEMGNQCFIVMQYVEGETLSTRIQTRPLTLRESLDIALQVADALVAAHSEGIIHRDIKPQNVIITPGGKIKVLDFGLAKRVQGERSRRDWGETPACLTDSDVLVGTVPYMSPEQAMGIPVDERSDLFSLGALHYECLAGRPPFTGSNKIDICSKVIHQTPPPPSQFNSCVPPELDRITLKALAKKPALRYQSARELMLDLRGVLETLQPGEQTGSPQLLPAPSSQDTTLLSTVGSNPGQTIFFRGALGVLNSAVRALLRSPLVWSTSSQIKRFCFGRRREPFNLLRGTRHESKARHHW